MTTTASVSKPTVKDLLSRPADEIVQLLGGIYEHSPWVAEGLVAKLDSNSSNDGANENTAIETVSALAVAMRDIVDASPAKRKLELLRAHPDLCHKVGKLKDLTEESQDEQSRAGLQSLTDDELERFNKCNAQYRERFDFPFILAVRNATKHTVLAALQGRVSNTVEDETVCAIAQVHKIAWMRLLAALDTSDAKGFLTCHVLDTANGCPAANLRIHLHRVAPAQDSGFLAEFITNFDGRLDCGPALKGGKEFTPGVYTFTFYVADYFASKGTYCSGLPFLDEVPLRFGIDNPDEHYHVPLLVSPWSFSTYRGS